jgi:hypothetical protein
VTNITNVVNNQGVINQDLVLFSNDTDTNDLLLHIPANTTSLMPSGAPTNQINIIHMTAPPVFQEGSGMITPAYDCTPAGTTFSPEVTIRFRYDPASIPVGMSEADLQISYYDNTAKTWVTVPSTVNTSLHFVYAQISHFTPYAVTFGVKPVIPVPTTTTVVVQFPTMTTQMTSTTTTSTTISTATTTTPVLIEKTTIATTLTPEAVATTISPTLSTTTLISTIPARSSWWLWAIVGVAVLGLVLGVSVVLRRRQH